MFGGSKTLSTLIINPLAFLADDPNLLDLATTPKVIVIILTIIIVPIATRASTRY